MAISRASNSSISNGTPKYKKFWDQTTSAVTGELLVVAGGGSGGNWYGGGGGAGGVLYYSNYSFQKGTTVITVGAGGSGTNDATNNVLAGNCGNNSSFGSLVATGGGYGANHAKEPVNGGSGGGASYGFIRSAVGISGQGNDGGNACSADNSTN